MCTHSKKKREKNSSPVISAEFEDVIYITSLIQLGVVVLRALNNRH
jgi:hypothetical protein